LTDCEVQSQETNYNDIYESNADDLQNELKYDFPELDLKVIFASERDRKRFVPISTDMAVNLKDILAAPCMDRVSKSEFVAVQSGMCLEAMDW